MNTNKFLREPYQLFVDISIIRKFVNLYVHLISFRNSPFSFSISESSKSDF